MAKKRVVYFDVLNILAALSVIYLHCNSAVYSYSDTWEWRQSLAVETLCYWAVPIFYMLSGANLFNYRSRYTTTEFFKKRFVKILVPFLIWTVIYALFYKVNPLEIGIKETFNRVFNTQIITTFWFFMPMFSIYLAMPIISLLKEHKKVLWYMVTLSFLLGSTLPYIFKYLDMPWNYGLDDLTSGGFIIYTVLGYLLAKTDFSLIKRLAIYLLGIFAMALRYFGTFYLSNRDGNLNTLLFDYFQYHVVMLAVAVFVFFKNSRVIAMLADNTKVANFFKELSSLSFGIYLIHILVMEILQIYISNTTFVWRLAIPPLVFVISAGVIFILKKIPIIKILVP